MIVSDPDNNILGNEADGIITINYTDDGDVGRVHVLQLSIDGLGFFETLFNVKSVESVIGTGFDTSGAGAPTSFDRFWMGPTYADTAHEILRHSGTSTSGPTQNPLTGSGNDGDGAYIEADSASDQRVYLKLSDPVAQGQRILSINNVTFQLYLKNVGSTVVGTTLTFRTDDAQADWPLNSMTTDGTEAGVYTLLSQLLSTNPRTGLAWTVQEVVDMQIGAIFRGESGPTVPKRLGFVRFLVDCEVGFYHDSIDGGDVANIGDAWQALAKDPCVTPTNDETQHIRVIPGVASQQLKFAMEDLPAEALSVISVDTRTRFTVRNVSDPQGQQPNDFPCGIATRPRANSNTLNYLEGPREQTNIGGTHVVVSLGGTIIGDERFAIGVGDPVGGCGGFQNYAGEDLGWGVYFDANFFETTRVGGVNPITVADVNGMSAGVRMNLGRLPEHRLSRVYAEVEFRRNPVGANFPHLAVDDDPNGVPATIDADFVPSQHSANKDFVFDFAGVPDASEVVNVTVRIRARTTAGAARGWLAFWRTAGGDTLEAEQTNDAFATKEFSRATNPDTGLAWTRDEINDLQIGWRAIGENDFFEKDLSALELEVEFIEIPEKIDAARDTGSRRLRLYRKPLQLFKARLPLQFLDPGLMGAVVVSHRAVPTIGGVPGQKRWQRRFMRVLREALDLNALRVELTLVDLRDFLLTFWMTMKSRSRGLSFDGMAIMSAGTTVRFARKTNAYHPDPNSGFINELTADEPKVNESGILVENASRNDLINSSFSEGAGNVFDSWTQFGTGLGGASIVEATGVPRLWAPDFFDRHILITGATTPGDVGIEQTIADVATGDSASPVGSRHVLTIDHIDPDGEPLSVLVERQDVTNQSYNPFTDSFASGVLWFPLPVRSTITRDRVGCFARMHEGLSNDLVDVKVRLAARTTADQTNRLYHTQWEGGTVVSGEQKCYPTSRILTRTGPVVRDADGLFAENTVGRLTWPVLRGTFFGIFEPIWQNVDLPDSSGRKLYIIGNVFDAENHDVVYFDVDLELLVFERKLAGVTTQSTLSMTAISMDQEIRIGARWTSEEEELDLPANSLTVFGGKNLEEGTSAAALGPIQPPSDNDMFLGSRDGSDLEMGDGTFSEFYVTQQVLSRDELRRLP